MDYHQVYNGSWLIDGSYALNAKCLPMILVERVDVVDNRPFELYGERAAELLLFEQLLRFGDTSYDCSIIQETIRSRRLIPSTSAFGLSVKPKMVDALWL